MILKFLFVQKLVESIKKFDRSREHTRLLLKKKSLNLSLVLVK